MKFKSPTDKEIPVVLTSGHSISVGPDYVDLPSHFVSAAMERGCIPEDATGAMIQSAQQFDPAVVVKKAMMMMIAAKERKDFTPSGDLDLRRVALRVGFQPTRQLLEEVYNEIKKADANPPAEADGDGA